MAAKFSGARLGELLWPELAGVGVLIAGHLGARLIDAALGWEKPFRRFQDWAHLAFLGVSGWAYGTARMPDLTKAIFIGDVTLLGSTFGDVIYGTAAPKVRALARGRGALSPQQKAAELEARRRAALTGGNAAGIIRERAGVLSVIEF